MKPRTVAYHLPLEPSAYDPAGRYFGRRKVDLRIFRGEFDRKPGVIIFSIQRMSIERTYKNNPLFYSGSYFMF